MDKLPVYKLVINDEDETGVNFVSLVPIQPLREISNTSTKISSNQEAESLRMTLSADVLKW